MYFACTLYVCIVATAGNSASIVGAVPRGTFAVAFLSRSLLSVPRFYLAALPAAARRDASCCRGRARECITSLESSSDSPVDGSWFRLALSNDLPLHCHSTSLGLSLIISLFRAVAFLLLFLPALIADEPLPPYTASSVTLNSGSAAIVTRMYRLTANN